MDSNYNSFKLIILIMCCHLIDKSLCATDTDISRLRSDLLTGYDPQSRPVQNHQNSTIVYFNIMLKGFELNERSSILNVYAWTILWWRDEHMKWDPSRYGNLTRIHFAAHELWQPDLTVNNNVDQSEIDHFANTRLVVFNTSWVYWVPPTKFQVGCQTNLRMWPYDHQNCTIVLESWAHDGNDIEIWVPINITQMDTSDYKPNREWDLISTWFKAWVFYYDSAPDIPYPSIELGLKMARKYPSHTATIVAPGFVIAVCILAAFWLSPGSPERLSIILVDMLINVFYLNYVYSIIPNNGDGVPLVLLFYRDSLFMLAFSLIWTICLRYLAATKRQSNVPLPGFMSRFLEYFPAKILCLEARPATGGGSSNEDGDAITGSGKDNPFQKDWAWLAHLLDRVAFLAYFTIYLIFYLALL